MTSVLITLRVLMATLGLFVLLPIAYGQSFMTIQPPPRPNSSVIVTPKFVPNPPASKTGVVQAQALQKPGEFNVIPVAAQQPPGVGPAPVVGPEEKETLIRTEMPGPQRLFIRESEEQFWNRYRNELKKQGLSVYIPESQVVSKEPYRPREFEPLTKLVEPAFVCHRRLLFEQPNFERAGWDLGILTPAVNLATFYYDTFLLPYHTCSDLHDRGECSTGKCLPGDQTPLYLYRERFSLTGALGQAGVVTGLIFLFP